METNTWTDLGVSVGTLALAGYTALLAKRTKASVDESARARQVWESMAADATRARLDAAAPPVNVVAKGVSEKLYAPTQGTDDRFESVWPADVPWIIPKDRYAKVALRWQVMISNDSQVVVEILCAGSIWSRRGGGDHRFILGPGAQEPVDLVAIYTIAEWLENFDAALGREEFPHVAFGRIMMSDRNDNGVSDSWDLSLTGAPVERNRANAGEVRVTGSGVLTQVEPAVSELGNRHRTYFISRSNGTAVPKV